MFFALLVLRENIQSISGRIQKKIKGFKQTESPDELEHIAVFISNRGRGSNLKAIIDAEKSGKIKASVDLVISDREDANGLRLAVKNEIPVLVKHLSDDKKREKYGKELADILNSKNITIAVLAGFTTILPPSYFNVFKGITINIHPGLVPDERDQTVLFPDGTEAPWNQGLITEKAVVNFIGKKFAGSTIHLATREADFGPVLSRKIIKTKPNDNVGSLYQRLKKVEHKGLIETLIKLSRKRL